MISVEEATNGLKQIADDNEENYLMGFLTKAEYNDKALQLNKRCEMRGIEPLARILGRDD